MRLGIASLGAMLASTRKPPSRSGSGDHPRARDGWLHRRRGGPADVERQRGPGDDSASRSGASGRREVVTVGEAGDALFAAPERPPEPAPAEKKPRKPLRNERVPAAERPVAQVAVDVNLAHLDRPFDYQVPEQLADQAVPGARVRVRFAGRLVDGFVLAREDTSEHTGRLGWLEKVVSPGTGPGPASSPASAEPSPTATPGRSPTSCASRCRHVTRGSRRRRRRSGRTRRHRSSTAGAPTPGGRRSSRPSRRTGPRTPSGRPCRARTGPPVSPRPPPPRPPPGGARCSWCPTAATSTASRPPARPWRARTPSSPSPPTSGPPSATGAGWPWRAGRCASSSAPAPPRSPRSSTRA